MKSTRRRRYLVAYDVSHPKRLRLVYRKMLGYGHPLQYSVFQCDLSAVEKLKLIAETGSISITWRTES